MKKYIIDLRVMAKEALNDNNFLLKLTSDRALPEMVPGQFVEVRVDGSQETFLRRPISINYVDKQANELWLLVRIAGNGTRRLSQLSVGETLNVILPLGNGFSIPTNTGDKLLLVGGGVGTAPMLYLGATLLQIGCKPSFLLGARTASDVLQRQDFERIGTVHITTEDGSLGDKGFVTDHSILATSFNKIYACGPKPMMLAIARYAKATSSDCEVSLENMMACGIGACLCCVEKTVRGNVCVCSEGPVFNINQLTWQI
ncbi:MAG: dihydroorotate dehydrogenase electron transfer subunit [Tannerella sp.]|jgi:dihydroorotate dehydrogenase electron transfer subunit|nr:dihydroorotate dehydrogenase electron transfer subunit [Tannerella sp.]